MMAWIYCIWWNLWLLTLSFGERKTLIDHRSVGWKMYCRWYRRKYLHANAELSTRHFRDSLERKKYETIIDWGDLTRCWEAGYERQIQREKINGPSNRYRTERTYSLDEIKPICQNSSPGFDHSLINREVVDRSWRPIFKLVQTLELWGQGTALLQTLECI